VERPCASYSQLYHLEQISCSHLALLESELLKNGVIDMRCLGDIKIDDTGSCVELAKHKPLLSLVSEIYENTENSSGFLLFRVIVYLLVAFVVLVLAVVTCVLSYLYISCVQAIRSIKPPVGRNYPPLEKAIRAMFCVILLVNSDLWPLALSAALDLASGLTASVSEVRKKLDSLQQTCWLPAEKLRPRLTIQASLDLPKDSESKLVSSAIESRCEVFYNIPHNLSNLNNPKFGLQCNRISL
jgi:hypothetical protein